MKIWKFRKTLNAQTRDGTRRHKVNSNRFAGTCLQEDLSDKLRNGNGRIPQTRGTKDATRFPERLDSSLCKFINEKTDNITKDMNRTGFECNKFLSHPILKWTRILQTLLVHN